uniref:Uncharacterized protein n=1 Tax=Clastoptera arizonana TaxID=38151 RepID=A0A1B6D8C0_9HEMI
MDVAKSIFSNRPHDGYSGKNNYNEKVQTALSDEEDEEIPNICGDESERLGLSAETISPTPGGPFSALTSSMWPQDILNLLGHLPDDPNSQPDYRLTNNKFIIPYQILVVYFKKHVK